MDADPLGELKLGQTRGVDRLSQSFPEVVHEGKSLNSLIPGRYISLKSEILAQWESLKAMSVVTFNLSRRPKFPCQRFSGRVGQLTFSASPTDPVRCPRALSCHYRPRQATGPAASAFLLPFGLVLRSRQSARKSVWSMSPGETRPKWRNDCTPQLTHGVRQSLVFRRWRATQARSSTQEPGSPTDPPMTLRSSSHQRWRSVGVRRQPPAMRPWRHGRNGPYSEAHSVSGPSRHKRQRPENPWRPGATRLFSPERRG